MNHDIVTEEQSRPKGLSAFLQKKHCLFHVVILVGIAYASVLSFLSIYSEMLHLVTASSFFFIVFAVVTFVTRPFTGKIYDHFGENKVMYPVLLSFAIGLAILSIVSSPFYYYYLQHLLALVMEPSFQLHKPLPFNNHPLVRWISYINVLYRTLVQAWVLSF